MEAQSKKKNSVIVISGNIGVGKTTLIQKLCEMYDWYPLFEDVDTNPYLEDFYRNPKRYSFEIQIFFLSARLKKYIDVLNKMKDKTIIMDRCVYEDISIFAKNLYNSGLMNRQQYDTYVEHAKVIAYIFEERDPIDSIFYLKNSNITQVMKRISNRGRECESKIEYSYIEGLHKSYEEWSRTDSRIITIDITGKDLYTVEDLNYVSEIISRSVFSGK